MDVCWIGGMGGFWVYKRGCKQQGEQSGGGKKKTKAKKRTKSEKAFFFLEMLASFIRGVFCFSLSGGGKGLFYRRGGRHVMIVVWWVLVLCVPLIPLECRNAYNAT